MRRRLVGALVALCFGCIDTSQSDARAGLYVAGTTLDQPITARGDVQLTVSRAELAFGPLTLCAGLQAGELCDEALVEWNDAVVVDVLDGTPKRVGVLEGVTGEARSFMYDLGLVSLLTQDRPLLLEAARALDGQSVRIEGSAQKDARTLRFRLTLAIAQTSDTEPGVPVVRKSPGEVFSHRIASRGDELLVRFDVRSWLESADFAGLLARCDTDLDCSRVLNLDAASQPSAAVRNAIVAGTRPSFTWNFEDD